MTEVVHGDPSSMLAVCILNTDVNISLDVPVS